MTILSWIPKIEKVKWQIKKEGEKRQKFFPPPDWPPVSQEELSPPQPPRWEAFQPAGWKVIQEGKLPWLGLLGPAGTVLGEPFGEMATKPFRKPTTEPNWRPPTPEEKARGIYAYQPTGAAIKSYREWQAPGVTIPGVEKLPSWVQFVIPKRPDLKMLLEIFPDLALYAAMPSATGLRTALRTGSADAVETAISEMVAKGLLPIAALEQAPGFAAKQIGRGVRGAAGIIGKEAALAPERGALGKVPRKVPAKVTNWDKLSIQERLDILAKEYPLDFILNKQAFRDLASKSWAEVPEGLTKAHIGKVLGEPKAAIPKAEAGIPKAVAPVTPEVTKGVVPETKVPVRGGKIVTLERVVPEYGRGFNRIKDIELISETEKNYRVWLEVEKRTQLIPKTQWRIEQPALPKAKAGIPQAPELISRGIKAPKGIKPPPPTKPPVAEGITPPPETFAGNIRLEKYPEEIRPYIKQWADANPQRIVEARRGVRSDVQVQADARKLVEEVGGNFDKLLKKWKPGQAWNPEEVVALRGVLRSKTEEILKFQNLISQGTDTTKNQLQLIAAINEHSAIQEGLHGVTAEAGRTLRQFRNDVSSVLLSGDVGKMNGLLEKLGGKGAADDIARELGRIDINNPSQVNSLIRSFTKPKFGDYINFIYINSLLSGPKTHIVNFGSNALSSVLSPIERTLAAAVEAPLSILQRRPRQRFFGEVAQDLFGLIRGIPEGVRAASYAAKHGFTLEQFAKYEVGRIPIKGKLGRIIGAPTTGMSMADQFWKAMNMSAALRTEVYRVARLEKLRGAEFLSRLRELMQSPTTDMLANAQKRAWDRLYMREPGKFTKALTGLRSGVNVGSVEPLRFFFPFIRTPVNLVKFGMERSPLGLLNPKLWQNLLAKNPAASDQLGAAVMGSLIASALAIYLVDGKITGAAPTSAAAKDRFYREGKQPYSIKFGDKWVSYQRIEPFNQPIVQVAAVVDAVQNSESDASVIEKATRAMATISRNFVSQTYMSGVSDLFDALEDPERYGGRWLERFTASLVVPFSAMSRTVAQATDKTIRQPKGIIQAIEANIPVLSKRVLSKITALGEEAKRESPAWSPILVSTEKDTPLNRELNRLQLNIGFVGKTIQGVTLTEQQQRQYQIIAGQMVKLALEKEVVKGSYRALSTDEKKVKYLQSIINDARDKARQQILRILPKAQIKSGSLSVPSPRKWVIDEGGGAGIPTGRKWVK